jgi:catechol 2,3-dioxygenase-like lactoylglutathione lyase family enzyme
MWCKKILKAQINVIMKKFLLFVSVLIFFFAPVDAQVKKVDGVEIVVSDMNRSVKFYSEVLSFKKVSDVELHGSEWENLYGVFGLHIRKVRMQLGDESIELIDYLTSGGRSIPEDFKSNDLSFQHIAIVVGDMEAAYKILHRFNVVHVSTAPQTLPPSIPEAAGVKAFYFQDPDKHNLELIYFPKGKGQEKWQHANGKIFLGIDHTAIGVSNTDNSHKFYHDILGFDRKGDSWNKGNEQAHLNNVEGASLHISGYRSVDGMGVEFLQYLNPGPGKEYPADTRADDIWNWITTIYVDDAEKVFNKLQSLNYQFVSKELIQLHEGNNTQKAFIVRDPDGHAVCLMEGG